MKITQKVFKNTSIVLTGQMIILLLNLLVNVYWARYFGETGFGVFSFALVYINFFSLVADFGMKPIIIREIARNKENAKKIIGNSIIIKFILSCLSIGFSIGTALILGYRDELMLVICILSLSVFVSDKLTTFRIIFESVFETELKMEYPMIFRIIDAIFLICATFVIIQYKLSLKTGSFLYVLCFIPGFILNLYLFLKICRPDFRLDFVQIKILFKESLPLAFYVALSRLYNSIDIFMLKSITGENDVGYYSAAYRIVNPLNFVPLAIVTSLFPLMSKYYKESDQLLEKSFNIGFKILSLFGIVMALTATFWGKKLILFLYGDRYAVSSNPFIYLMWSELFVFLVFFLVDFNTSTNRQKSNAIATVGMLTLNVAVNFFAIPRYHVMGTAVSKMLSSMMGFGILYAFNFHLINRIHILRKLVGMVLIFALWLLVTKNFNLLIVAVASFGLLIGLIYLFGYFTTDEQKEIKEIFHSIVKTRLPKLR